MASLDQTSPRRLATFGGRRRVAGSWLLKAVDGIPAGGAARSAAVFVELGLAEVVMFLFKNKTGNRVTLFNESGNVFLFLVEYRVLRVCNKNNFRCSGGLLAFSKNEISLCHKKHATHATHKKQLLQHKWCDTNNATNATQKTASTSQHYPNRQMFIGWCQDSTFPNLSFAAPLRTIPGLPGG